MRFKYFHKIITYFIAIIGIFSIWFWSNSINLWLFFLIPFIIVSWFLEPPLIEQKKYTFIWDFISVLVLIIEAGILIFYRGSYFIDRAIELAIFLQINKLFNRRNARDYLQINLLAILHITGVSIFDVDIWYLIIFIVFIVVLPWSLILLNLRFDVELNYENDSNPDGVNVRRILNSKRVMDWEFLFKSSIFSVVTIIFSSFLFVFFPRIGLGIFNLSAKSREKVIGFGDEIVIGDMSSSLDEEIVIRYFIKSTSSKLPDKQNIYWRATTYDHFDGKRWKRSQRKSKEIIPNRDYYHLMDDNYKNSSTKDYHVILTPIDSSFLPIPVGTYKMTFNFDKNQQDNVETVLQFDDYSLNVTRKRFSSNYLHYLVSVINNKNDIKNTEKEKNIYLQLPDLSDKVYDLSKSLIESGDDNITNAKKVALYFQKNFTYSLNIKFPPNSNYLERFLFYEKKGYCEFFSTAMVILLRTQKIPARQVVGYLGGELNRFGNYYVIRNKNAHSWVEVYEPSSGWILFDPTPTSEISFQSNNNFINTIAQFWDTIKLFWQNDIVTYNLDKQVSLMLSLKNYFLSLKNHEFYRTITNNNNILREKKDNKDNHIIIIIIASLLVIILLFFIYFAIHKFRKKKSNILNKQQKIASEILFKLDKILIQFNLPRPNYTPPKMYCIILKNKSFPLSKEVELLVDIYNEIRFGTKPYTIELQNKVKELFNIILNFGKDPIDIGDKKTEN